jgi:hypothetical protein
VSSSGTTTFSTLSNAATAITSSFAIQVGSYTAAFTDIVTTASYTGPVSVCATYPDTNPEDSLVDGTFIQERNIRFLHDESGTFVDRTMSLSDLACPLTPLIPCPGSIAPCLDPMRNQVCARVASLSFFTVALHVGDSDGDGVPDPYDTCTQITSGQEVARAKLLLRGLDKPPGQQKLVWKGSFVPDGGGPLDLHVTGLHLFVGDEGGSTSVDVNLPGGLVGENPSNTCDPRDGWQVKGSPAFSRLRLRQPLGFRRCGLYTIRPRDHPRDRQGFPRQEQRLGEFHRQGKERALLRRARVGEAGRHRPRCSTRRR